MKFMLVRRTDSESGLRNTCGNLTSIFLLLLIVFFGNVTCSQDTEQSLLERLKNIDTELPLSDGNLLIVNVYKVQAIVLHETRGQAQEQIAEQLVTEVFKPFIGLWNSYLGDEKTFRDWFIPKLLNKEHPIHSKLEDILSVDFNPLFEGTVAKIEAMTGRQPKGRWYLIFGSAATNLGGFGGGDMVIDFSSRFSTPEQIRFALPHEIHHQIFGRLKENDPDAGTVLDRIISEGFATYFNYLYWNNEGQEISPAKSVGYTEQEWAWSLEHELQILNEAKKYLSSKERSDINTFLSRSDKLFNESPTAIGYFVGFRICQAYVDRHGEQSWKDLFELPLRKILVSCAYEEYIHKLASTHDEE